MGIFDKRRQSLGIASGGTNTQSGSIFDKRRNELAEKAKIKPKSKQEVQEKRLNEGEKPYMTYEQHENFEKAESPITAKKQPSKEQLKSNMTQFVSGMAESSIPRAVRSMQKMSGHNTLAERMVEESKPYSNASRTIGMIAGEVATQPLTYGILGKAASGTKLLSKIGSPFIRNVVAGQMADTAIQTPITVAEGVANKRSIGQIAGDVAVQQATDLAGNLAFGGAEAGIKALKNALRKPVSEVAETAAEIIPLQKVKYSTKSGSYKIKNTAFEKAVNEYNEAIETIQNHFRTNELRTDEVTKIKSELGIDLDGIINRMEQAEKNIQLPKSDSMKLKRAAGAASEKSYKLAEDIHSQKPNIKQTVDESVKQPTQPIQAKTGATQVNAPSINKTVAEGVQTPKVDFTPSTPKQQKYVEQYKAKLPNTEEELKQTIASLESQKAVEKDGQKLLKINLQLFAIKEKLAGLSKAYSNTLKNTDAIPEEVKKLLDEGDFRYDPLTEKLQIETARKKITADSQGEMQKIQDLSRTEYNQDDVNVGMELLHDLSNKQNLSADDIANIRKTAKGVSQAGRTQGRGVQAFAKYTRTKEGIIASTQKIVDKTEEAIKKTNPNLWKRVQSETKAIVEKAKKEGKPVDPDQVLSMVKKKYKVPDLTNDDIKVIADYMEKYKNAVQGSREQKELWQKVMQIMSSKIPPTMVDKFRGLQRISYLLNPKTLLVRNPVGNIIMNIAETVKDLPGGMVDKAVSAIRKSERTTTLPSIGRLNAQFKGMKEGMKEAIKDVKANVNTSPTVGMLEMPRRDVFNNNKIFGKVLNQLDKKVGQMLQLGDRPFYQAAYDERISELLKIGKTKTITQEMTDSAHEYALERVFQNDSGIAQFFKSIKTPPANAPAGVKSAWGFIANGIIPFSKTPANILNKLLEYSPAGLAKAIGHAGLAKAGKTVFNQKYFVDNIARSLTGTGLALLGYALASKGIVKGKTDSDKDVAAFERLMGINSYSIVMDGKSYTFDWAQPIGSVLAAGADAYYSGMNKDNFSEQLSAALQGYGNTFFNQSMMQSLSRFLNTYNPISGVVNSFTSTTNIVTPTIGSQATKVIDPYVRDTSANTALGETANKLMARTPGLSMTLPKKVDTLGEPQKQAQGRGIFARAVEQFVSPGYFGDVDKANGTMKRIYEIYKATDEKAVFPKLAPDSFTVEGEKVKLTAEQKREWQKISGEYYSKNFEARLKDKKDSNSKAKALKKLADDAYDVAKKKLFKKN